MKIHLIKEATINGFTAKHSSSKIPFDDFITKLKFADWKVPSDIKQTFNTADILGNNCSRVVFDIGGNNFRTICKYAFSKKQVHLFIMWIGTHAEYTKLCKEGNQYSVSIF